MERKTLAVAAFNQKDAAGSRVITGVASVIGNIDSVGDIVVRGAFAKAIRDFKNGRSRAVFLWGHDYRQPPIAKILDMKEVGRDGLPPAVLAKCPEATGGLIVKRQYFKDAFADRVYQSIIEGAVTQMSFAYDILDSEDATVNGKEVRLLKELAVFDLSDVNWGANPATVAAGAKKRPTARLAAFQGRQRRLRSFADDLKGQGGVHDLQMRTASLQLFLAKGKLENLRLQHDAKNNATNDARARRILLRARAALLG